MKHQAAHGDVDKGFTGGGQPLVVLAEATVLIQPGQCTLDHPSTWQHLEARRDGGRFHSRPNPEAAFARPPVLDDLDIPGEMLASLGQEAPVIATISPELSQTWELLWHVTNKLTSRISVANIGCVDQHDQEEAKGIDDNVPLASIDLCSAPFRLETRTAPATKSCQMNRWTVMSTGNFGSPGSPVRASICRGCTPAECAARFD
jgi:hypothetical protein